jgi:hypothetical protein
MALLKPINTAGIGILGTVTFIWGLWLASPFWTVFSGDPNYSAMAQLAPEWAWGLFGIAVGAVILAGVIKNSYRALTRGATVAYYFWLAITGMHLVSNWKSEMWIFTLMSALYAIFIALNLRVNEKIIEFSVSKKERN